MGSKMTDEERRQLIDKLNRETEEFIRAKQKKNEKFEYKDGFTDENIDEILATHPAFMNKQPTAEEIENNPLLKGLQEIQYDPDDTPYEKAKAYKKDGNFQFKCKKYKFACVAYTEALRANCTDTEMLTVLYSNRAAANYHLENYRSSLLDSTQAVKLSPHRIKSLLRCAQCCQKLKRWEDAIGWCRIIQSLEADNKAAQDIQASCTKEKKIEERNNRKMTLAKQKEEKKQQQLVDAIELRKINLKLPDIDNSSDDESDDIATNGITKGLKNVYLDENNTLVWPVLFLYPEFQTTDFIETYHENVPFSDVLENVFAQHADWDLNHHYVVSELLLFYENTENETLYEVPLSKTLGEVLSHSSYVVQASTPNLFVVSKLSSFAETFKAKWKKVVKR